MNARRTGTGLVAALVGLVLLAPAAQATPITTGGSAEGPVAATGLTTPNSCITLNEGDWKACLVGRGGGGDLPYLPVPLPHSVAGCIALNRGDAVACRAGSEDGSYLR